jgi:hypothetical protein
MGTDDGMIDGQAVSFRLIKGQMLHLQRFPNSLKKVSENTAR